MPDDRRSRTIPPAAWLGLVLLAACAGGGWWWLRGRATGSAAGPTASDPPPVLVATAAEVFDQADLVVKVKEPLPAEWPLARLDPVLRALLRAAGAELAMPDGAPAKVVINEYLDVAHGFFDGDEPGMANGLMDSLARTLRPKEFVVG